MKITRIAPSPSGNFHIGTARTAYLNYLAAKASGGKFILRIDDTDRSRSDDRYVQDILDSMQWLGMDYDLFFRQSDRFDRYMQVAQDLIDQEKAINLDGAIFLKTDSQINSWVDKIAGTITNSGDQFDPNQIVLIKSDGSPSYHFSNVVDDIDYGVNCIIRGVDHIPNTLKHVFLYDALGHPLPDYYHIGLIHDKNGKKYSKRDNAISLQSFRDMGYLPDSILNILIRMGWSHPDPNFDQKHKLIPKDFAIQIFNQGTLKSSPSKMDMSKLDYYNKQYKKIVNLS